MQQTLTKRSHDFERWQEGEYRRTGQEEREGANVNEVLTISNNKRNKNPIIVLYSKA